MGKGLGLFLYCLSRILFVSAVQIKYPTTNDEYMFTNLTFNHAESPVWDPATNTLYWVDVLNQNVHALDYYSKKHKVKHISFGEVNIVMPIKNSRRVLVAVRSGLFILDWDKPGDSALRLITVFDNASPDHVLNEGKADALGRFWGGTKGRQIGNRVELDQGSLYSLEAPYFIPTIQVKPVSVSNGLVWSRNNTVMYYIDSCTGKIEAFDYNLEKGHLSRRRTILNVRKLWPEPVMPDGMTIDRDGLLWVALIFDGSIIRIDPDRRLVIEKFKLPVTQSTSMTWAGPKLDALVVTTSRRNMDALTLRNQPMAGAMFILHKLGTSGVPDHKFVFPNADNY